MTCYSRGIGRLIIGDEFDTTRRRFLSGSLTDGTISIDGKPLPPEPTPERGIVFQRYSVFPHLTVRDNLVLANDFDDAPVLARRFGARRRAAIACTPAERPVMNAEAMKFTKLASPTASRGLVTASRKALIAVIALVTLISGTDSVG